MATEKDIWTPIRPDELRVGHYIKINHRWFDHPFVRKIFMLASEDEISIIRNAGLTRLFVDHQKSELSLASSTSQGPPEDESSLPAIAAQIKGEKDAHCANVIARREQLSEVRNRYRASVDRAHNLLGMLNATDPTCAQEIGILVDQVLETLDGDSTPLALVASVAPLNVRQRNALLGSDAASLAGVIGKRLGLPANELRDLVMAASMHLVGLQRMPPHLAVERPGEFNATEPAFRAYPLISSQIAEECGGFPRAVLRILQEHRERPDGSGFPRGIASGDIHPSATILGMIREFQIQCSAEKSSPAAALSYMYKNMRSVFGDKLITCLIACLTVYPPGTFVLLSDGSIARVLRINEESRMRPVIGVIDEEDSSHDHDIVDLSQDQGLTISKFADQTMVPRNYVDQDQAEWVGVAVAPRAIAAA